MNKLLKKIRTILNDRRIRRTMKLVVSVISVIIVFVSTYALILPAITEEKNAACGIEEHQHTDDCYREELICNLPESEGHRHTDSCYTVKSVLSCDASVHEHNENCYDENGELICRLEEHLHDGSCYQEEKELTCTIEESEGHTHSASCYEKKLVCGKEVHIHSVDCYEADGNSGSQPEAGKDSNSAAADDTPDDASDSASDSASDGSPGSPSGGISDNASDSNSDDTLDDTVNLPSGENADSMQDTSADKYVPELDPLNMDAMLNDHTAVYYYHAKDGEAIPADSAEITDWTRVKKDTELSSKDLIRLYFAYTIPAGSLNETNPAARYRLPDNIHLTDRQIKAINKNRNGISAEYDKSSAEYKQYLGAEAIEGSRRPDERRKGGAEEYISAVVRVEKTSDGGQELVFTFVPYSVEKNQNTYDTDGKIISAGEKITGWFACDFALSQIDWEEEETKTADIIFVREDKNEDIKEISTRLILVEQLVEQGDETAASVPDSKEASEEESDKDSKEASKEESDKDSKEVSKEESDKDSKEDSAEDSADETVQESGDGTEISEGDDNKSTSKKRGESEKGSTEPGRSSSNESTDLRDFLTKVAVSGASLIDGHYVVQAGQTYSVTLTFKESPQVQFDNDAVLIYQMPDGIVIPAETTTPISIAIVSNGRTYEIPAAITADTSGQISVTFDDSDPNFVYLEDATNVGFRVVVDAQFTRDISKTEWSSMAERDIILDTTDVSDAYVTKSGVFDEQTGKFTYTIKVIANGNPQNVNVNDIISGEALLFNNDVAITGNSSVPVQNPAENGFNYTFPAMQDGEEITITYTASIDPSKASNG
jgi:hypothetical protein